jgi:hypothetical protein
MPEINCYIPIKIRITGRLSDVQLDELGETIVRALAARISFAQRIIASHDGNHWLRRDVELAREHYDPAQEGVAPPEYSIPSYQGGGKRKKVALKKRQRPEESGERPSLAIFADLEAAQAQILSFYPDPKPRGNNMFGVYGVWEQDFKPYVFFVSGIIQEGAYRDRLWIEKIPLVSGKVEKDRFVPAGAGNIPVAVSANERCTLRILIGPKTQKGQKFYATLRRQSGRVTPVFLSSGTLAKWRGKVIRFGVASAGEIIEVTGKAPPPPKEEPKRIAPWRDFYEGGLPAEPLDGEPEWLWRWYGWFDMQPAEVRKNRLVQAVFTDWTEAGKWEDFREGHLYHIWIPRFYKAFCQKVALEMLATSRKNMTEFLASLPQNETEWKTRFTARVRALREPAEWLDPITYKRAQLKEKEKELLWGLAGSHRNPADLPGLRDELKQVREGLRQLEATRAGEESVTALFKWQQEMEPLLVLLTIRGGKQIETLESALVWASKADPNELLFHVRQQVEWLIEKSHEAEREIQNDPDAAYKLKFVQEVANAQLAAWLQFKPVFRDSIERLTHTSILAWIGLGIAVLFLTFAFPTLGIALSATISVPTAYRSVRRAMQLSRLSGTRLAQYGYEPLVSKQEIQAAMLEAVLNVFFALLDLGVLTWAGIQTVRVLRALSKPDARKVASAVGRELEERFLTGWQQFDRWPADLTDSIRNQVIRQLDQINPTWPLGMTGRQTTEYVDQVVHAVQRELLVRYEWQFLELQRKFQAALEAGPIDDVGAWLSKEVPDAQKFFTDRIRQELAPGNPLYDNTIGRAVAGHPPLAAPERPTFLGEATPAQFEALARELGPMADLLTPDLLFNLGRAVGADYWTLARRLNTLLSRVEGPEQVLAKLDELLVGRADARHIFSALEGTANPRQILEALTRTPEVLNFHSKLHGGVHELFEAMNRASPDGEVVRFLRALDEPGGRVRVRGLARAKGVDEPGGLVREIRRPDGSSLFEHWDGLEKGWSRYQGRIVDEAAETLEFLPFEVRDWGKYEWSGRQLGVVSTPEGAQGAYIRTGGGGSALPGEPAKGDVSFFSGWLKYKEIDKHTGEFIADSPVREWMIKPKGGRLGKPGTPEAQLKAELSGWTKSNVGTPSGHPETDIKRLNDWLRSHDVDVGGGFKVGDKITTLKETELTRLPGPTEVLDPTDYVMRGGKVYKRRYGKIIEIP